MWEEYCNNIMSSRHETALLAPEWGVAVNSVFVCVRYCSVLYTCALSTKLPHDIKVCFPFKDNFLTQL